MRASWLALVRTAVAVGDKADRPDWSFLEESASPRFQRPEDKLDLEPNYVGPRSGLEEASNDRLYDEFEEERPKAMRQAPEKSFADGVHESWAFQETRHRIDRASSLSQTRSDDYEPQTPMKRPPPFKSDERKNGAPQEGWLDCATRHGECRCPGGKVRYGAKGKKLDVWTMPIPVGGKSKVICEVNPIRDARVHFPDDPGPVPTRVCECSEKRMRISMHFSPNGPGPDGGPGNPGGRNGGPGGVGGAGVGQGPSGEQAIDKLNKKASSLAEMEWNDADLYGEGPSEDPNGPRDLCLTVEKPGLSDSLIQTEEGQDSKFIEGLDELKELADFELAHELIFQKCESETEIGTAHEWVFQQSSGQIRHSKSGKCLAAYWSGGVPHLRGQDCVNTESQVALQRWRLPQYPTNTGAARGSKHVTEIVVGYGGKTDRALCLIAKAGTQKNTGALAIEKCGHGNSQWEVTRTYDHGWKVCAQENGHCQGEETANCEGEIRFGDGERGRWAFPIAVPSVEGKVAAMACTPSVLKEIAVQDPVEIPDLGNPDFRECQCRDAVGILGGAAAQTMLWIVIAGACGALLIGGGIVAMKMAKSAGGGWGGEEEEWEDGEEWDWNAEGGGEEEEWGEEGW